MNGKKANLVVTDPPYNVAYEGTAGTIQNDSMEDGKFYEFLFSLLSVCMMFVRTVQAFMFFMLIRKV